MDKASTGRVVIELLPNKSTKDGFTIDYEREEWGRIIDVGAPGPDLFTTPQILYYRLTGIHPGPWKKDDLILIPKIRREFIGINGKNRSIIFQGDISAFRKSGGDPAGPTLIGFWRFLCGHINGAATALVNLWHRRRRA